jgi:hypothetical protein
MSATVSTTDASKVNGKLKDNMLLLLQMQQSAIIADNIIRSMFKEQHLLI